MFRTTRNLPSPAPALAQARQIVANPQPDHTQHQRARAWAILKSARGTPVIQHRISTTQNPQGAA